MSKTDCPSCWIFTKVIEGLFSHPYFFYRAQHKKRGLLQQMLVALQLANKEQQIEKDELSYMNRK